MAERHKWRILQPSTRAFYREGRRTRGYSVLDFAHGYVYARWPYHYLGARRIPLLARPLVLLGGLLVMRRHGKKPEERHRPRADSYHGKVLPLDAATRLVTLNLPLDVRNLEQVIPYPVARDIVLQNPDHLVALECPCRAAREKPCLPLDVCLIVGEPFAGFIAEHHPATSRWISQGDAVGILQAEHERGHVHHAFFKDAMLGRFYAICNCCSCCCGAMRAFAHGVPMLASSGYVSRVEAESCAGCGACVGTCQFRALEMGEKTVRIDEARCMGCGVCVSKCPRRALSLVRDPTKSEPLDVRELAGSRPA